MTTSYAALLMQRQWRVKRDRRDLAVARMFVTKLQANYRGAMARREQEVMKRAIRTLQSVVRRRRPRAQGLSVDVKEVALHAATRAAQGTFQKEKADHSHMNGDSEMLSPVQAAAKTAATSSPAQVAALESSGRFTFNSLPI